MSLSSVEMELSVVKPGEVILRKLFHEFTVLADKKLDSMLTSEPLEKPVAKSLQRGEDPIFDQLLTAFGSLAEHCLPSMLRVLFHWYDRQIAATSVFAEENQRIIKSTTDSQSVSSKSGSLTKSNIQSLDNSDIEIYYTLEKRDLAVEFIFCLVLIEVLKQLPLHPGYDDLTNHIENLAFKHFKFREDAQANPNLTNINMIADLYAEVIGVLAQSRFQSVRKRFMSEFKELRAKEPSPITTHSIISLLMGMKFFRIKMVPIEEFEASFQFMHECAVYFMEVKDKDIKHALAGLFVEILVPVAATVKNEVNVPCLKNFVELLYSPTLDLCTKKKHCLALFPLVTCLLCVSQKAFFLSNWHYFLAMCLSHLKNRDPKMSRVALESLYRLLWVYMIRIKCESNTATQTRLHSIVNSLFPKGSKAVVPRDTPLNIFVKIIQFIAQERLDFAMKEIVFDLLSVGRSIKIILTPERMSIGLRSFLVVADSLQQKDGDPPMPRTIGVLPSGNTLRVKKTFLNKMLTDEMAKNIGMNHYYPYVRKTLGDILRALDIQFGRPLMMTSIQNVNKEVDDMLSGERKPKIDLFRTCVAAIPRLLPDGISKSDLIDLLARLTINVDEEMVLLAFQSLQNLVLDFPDWREDVIEGFVHFILYEINDAFQELIENSLKMLLQLLTCWKNAVQQLQEHHSRSASKLDQIAQVLHNVDALAMIMMCICRQPIRRLASYLLKESRIISNLLLANSGKNYDEPVATVIDLTCPAIIENCFPYVSSNEKATIVSMAYQVDLQWLAERSGQAWVFDRENSTTKSSTALNTGGSLVDSKASQSSADIGLIADNGEDELKLNAWNSCFMALMPAVIKHCPNAVALAWPIICQRQNTLFTYIDPNPVNDNRASSILRPASSNLKRVISSYDRSFYLELWKNYLMFACSVAPSSIIAPQAKFAHFPDCASPDSMSEKLNPSVPPIEGNRSPIMNRGMSAQSLFKQIIPLLRCDQCDLRNAVVLGLSQVNHYALADLLEELIPYYREAIDKKQENLRRRKRREMLRLQIGRLFKFIAERKIFALCPVVLDQRQALSSALVEYIDGVRSYFESETTGTDKETLDIKESFCHFICHLIRSFPIESRDSKLTHELRHNLFNLFSSWSGKYGHMFLQKDKDFSQEPILEFNKMTELEYLSVRSMSTVLCGGSIFDGQNLLDGSSLYFWLTNLLNASEKKINEVGLETLVLLLENNNSESGQLLEWIIECCYTKNSKIADSCFTALATIFSIREYPCDRYIAIIIVTIVNVACPRIEIQQLALQLLQILDNRFFASTTQDYGSRLLQEQPRLEHTTNLEPSHTLKAGGHSLKEFEPILVNLYPCSQYNISKRMAYLHPQLTMIVFSEITYRFQTARPTVCQNLLHFLIPWLYNMQLVDPIAQHNSSQNDGYTFSRTSMAPGEDDQTEGWGSIESTQMVLNNLLFITMKFGDDYAPELEQVWAAICVNRPNNLKIIIRYLFILTGLAPNELLSYAKRIAIYLARAQPERVIDELMTELQAVEFLSFNAERTEAFPYFRIVNRKCSATHLDEETPSGNHNHNRKGQASDATTEVGTLHTKRHSKDLHTKYELESNRNYDSFNGSASSEEYNIFTELSTNGDDSLPLSDRYVNAATPQPRPLPMPEYGGFYAPLNELLNSTGNSGGLLTTQTSTQNAGFHRCNLALMLLCDIITQDISVDWSPHIPLMLHILFLGMDHSKPIVYEHCKQLLLNLLVVCCKHRDNLCVARILLNNRILQQNYGLTIHSSFPYNYHSANLNDSNSSANQKSSELDLNKIFTKSSENIVTATATASESIHLNDIHLNLDKEEEADNESGEKEEEVDEEAQDKSDVAHKMMMAQDGAIQDKPLKFNLEVYIKTLIDFISSKRGSPLWNYEDITAKVWSIRSAEQMGCFVEHVLFVFKESLPLAKIENRWADIALQLALSCSSRHYAGRSLQIFRALKIPINTRMLSDILSRLVETVSEQGEDMQGYVTELMLTIESAIDTFDFKPRNILELINEYFHFDVEMEETDGPSAPEAFDEEEDEAGDSESEKRDDLVEDDFLSNEETVQATHHAPLQSTGSSATLVAGPNGMAVSAETSKLLLKMPSRSTSYSMSFPTRKFNFLDENHHSRDHYPRFCTPNDVDSFYSLKNQRSKCNSLTSVAIGRSQSATSLKNLVEPAFDDKTSILAQFFWIALIMLETDYEHEFLLALRVLDKVLGKLSLDDPECQEKIDKVQANCKWHHFPGVHSLLLKGLASSVNYEPTINLLHKLTPYLNVTVVDPTKSETSFPFHVMAMLPYLLHNYDDPNLLCIQAAISFAQWCNEVSNKLENLATVMTLYSKRCFSKENQQWTKCVVKYLYDAYPASFVNIIPFLVEVAEKGPPIFLNHILSILHFMLNYIDLSTTRLINDDILRVVTKYIESAQWKEALKILKLAVTRSSTLAAPSYSHSSTYASSIISSIVSCGSYTDSMSSFSESEFSSVKRELPGRTMDFAFDLSECPVVGWKLIEKRHTMSEAARAREMPSVPQTDSAVSSLAITENGISEKNDFTLDKLFEVNREAGQSVPSSSSPEITSGQSSSVGMINPFVNQTDSSTLKRSVASQIKIRERLIGLLNRCGQRTSGLPKSPSVIFSQNSDVVEHKSSMASSVEDISATNNDVSGDSKHDDTAHGEFAFFKEFDFLEYELESQEGESLDNFNWGVRRKSLSNLDQDELSSKTGHTDTLKPQTSLSGYLSSSKSKSNQDDFSSDDEVESVSPLYESEIQPELPEHNSLTQSRPASLISHGSSHSLGSEAEFTLTTLTTTPPNLSKLPDIESNDEHWSALFLQMINDQTGCGLATCNQTLAQILRYTLERVAYLTRESCELLQASGGQLGEVATRFLDLLDVMATQVDFPFVHLDAHLFTSIPRLIEDHRFSLLELREHWETFNEKRELLSECLLRLKATTSGTEEESHSSMGELCKPLYKMHFQLFLLVDCYLKFVDLLRSIPNRAEVSNHSIEMTILRNELKRSLQESVTFSSTTNFSSPIESSLNKENEQELKELIESKEYAKAIYFVRILKENIADLPGDDVIETLLIMYCRIMLENQSSYLIITDPEYNLADIIRQLMDTSGLIYNP